jgi:hypothetical protein
MRRVDNGAALSTNSVFRAQPSLAIRPYSTFPIRCGSGQNNAA